MRFVIADPALTGQIGHHANFVRYLTDAIRDRGFEPMIFGHIEVERSIREALCAVPHFIASTYAFTDEDPYCGWLTGFMTFKEITRRDLARLPPVGRNDVVLLHSVKAAQMMATLEWAATLPEDDCPLIVIEMGGRPGLDVRETAPGVTEMAPPDTNKDAQPALCRYASLFGPGVGRRPVHVVTLDASVSAAHAQIMMRDIPTLPFSTPAVTALRRRIGGPGGGPLTIATVGHQHVAKGYHVIPEIIARLLETESDVRFLVHNSDPDLQLTALKAPIEQTRARLEQMAADDPRIMLEHRAVDLEEWSRLLDRCDIILCPYDSQIYAVQHSGLASDAVANGIPLVVPAGTTLARWVDEFQTGAVFERQSIDGIVDAVRAMIRNYGVHADRAYAAAEKWAATRGPGGFINALLKLKDRPSSFAEAATPVESTAAWVLKLRGDAFLRERDLEGARECYQRAVAARPAFSEAYCNLGIALQQLGDLAGAEAALRCADTLTPERVSILANLGAVLGTMGRGEEGAALLRRAIALEPRNGGLKNNLALTLSVMGRREEAIAELEKGVMELPGEAMLWFNLGGLCDAVGDHDKALAAYRKTEALNPDYPGLRQRLQAATS